MKNIFILAVIIISGCGGVMDYRVMPLDIQGKISPEVKTPIVVATPGFKHGINDCAKLISSGPTDACSAQIVDISESGVFQAEIHQGMRGCVYLLVPPLLDLFCDYQSYLLIAIKSNPTVVYLVTIEDGEHKISRIGQSKAISRYTLKVISVSKLPNNLGGYKDKKLLIRLQITAQRKLNESYPTKHSTRTRLTARRLI